MKGVSYIRSFGSKACVDAPIYVVKQVHNRTRASKTTIGIADEVMCRRIKSLWTARRASIG